MEKDEILISLFVVVAILITILGIKFIVTTIDLYKFRSCYDINFQDVSCQKYLSY